jgi:hypothetical protein
MSPYLTPSGPDGLAIAVDALLDPHPLVAGAPPLVAV